MKSKIIISIIIILFFLIAGFIIYLNNVLLPVKLKAKIIRELEKNIGKNVKIERLHYNLFKGLVIENFLVFDKTAEKTYLSAKEISFQLLILPLLQKKIIIPVLRIDSVNLYLALRQDNTLNITEVFKRWPMQKGKPKIAVFVQKIDLSNGKCQFKDEHTEPNYIKEIVDLKIGIGINPLGQIKFLLQGKIPNQQNNPTFITATGKYNLLNQDLQCKTKLANVVVDDYLFYLKNLPFSVSKGAVDNVELDIDLKDKRLSLKGIASGKNLELRKENFVLSADIDIEPLIQYDFQNKELDYSAKAKLSKGAFLGVKYLNITDIVGAINLVKNKIYSDGLNAQALGSPIIIAGGLEDFENLNLKLNISSERINLERLADIWPNLSKDLMISGNSTLNLGLEGSLKKLPLDVKAAAQIMDAKAQIPLIKEPLTEINGLIKFSVNQLAWENFSFLFKQAEYKSSGTLTDFNEPNIDFNLASEILALDTSLNIKDKLIRIDNCSGKYQNSDFLVKGSLNMEDSANPLLSLNTESNVLLQDTFIFLPAGVRANLQKMKLEGPCKITGFLNGKAKDVKNWNANFKLSSDYLSAYGLKLDGLNFSLVQKDGVINISDLRCQPYGGSLYARISLNLQLEIPVYTARVELSDIDLEKLKMDTKFKDKDVSGLFNASADLEGTTKELQALAGKGKIRMQNGRLWEMSLFKGLGEFLFLPLYQKIIFTNADIRFAVHDGAIEITESYLGSEELELAGTGQIGFDGTLDLTLHSEINADLIKDSPDLRKFTSAVLGNILVIKVEGTTDKPHYKTVPRTKEIIKQIKRLFSGD